MENKIHLIGNAHLDPVWLWRWTDGYNEVMQTFRSMLDRLSEYEGVIFTAGGAQYYKWVEETDPSMFREIQEAVRSGRWSIVNGWAIQPDCNMPSGESFARQSLYNQLYYYDRFGKICDTGYNVDSFGHAASLPKLLNGGGMYCYVFMRPSPKENPDIPEDAFQWESADGSRVVAYRIHESYGESGPENISKKIGGYFIDDLNKRNYPLMFFYGVGNHGGGPTKGDIEFIEEKYEPNDDNSKFVFSDPDRYFKSLTEAMPDLPVWTDELQRHSAGCYSAMSRVKALNRKAEQALYSAEVWDTVASKLTGAESHTEEIKKAWEKVMFSQFHDSLCGCSIKEVYDDICGFQQYAITAAEKIKAVAQVKISRNIDTWIDGIGEPVRTEIRHMGMPEGFPRCITVFNSLSYDAKMPVRAIFQSSKVTDSDSNEIKFANVRSSRSNDSHTDTVFVADVPAFGYKTYWLSNDRDYDYHKYFESYLDSSEDIVLENKFLKAVINSKTGNISSLISSGHEFAHSELAELTVIDDSDTDTWSHNNDYFRNVLGEMNFIKLEYVENNDVRQVVRAYYSFGDSLVTKEYRLYSELKTIYIKLHIEWREKNALLKMCFDIGGENPVSTSEIPMDFIKRPADGKESVEQQWTDVTSDFDHKKYGIAVINDSKYSYSCVCSELRQTVLRNKIFADHYSDRPLADFRYTDEGEQECEFGIFVHRGDAEETEITEEAAKLNQRFDVWCESSHKGNLPQKNGFITVDKDNCLVSAVKLCEDGSDDTVIRLWETKGEEETEITVKSKLLNCFFRSTIYAHQVKTYRIDRDGRAREYNFLEGIPAEKR